MKRAISFSFAAFLAAVTFQVKAQEVAQTNVQPVNNALAMVTKLEPVTFNYDKPWVEKLKLPSTSQYGFVGTDAKTAVPSVIAVEAKQYPAGKNAFNAATLTKVDYERLLPLLVASIKEQQAQIEELKRELRALKPQNAK